MCITLKEFAKYVDVKLKTMKNKFNVKCNENFLLEKVHYFVIRESENSPENRDNLRGVKSSIYLTFLGVWKLLPTFRGEIPSQLYDWFGEKLYELMKSNRLTSGEFFLTDHVGMIVHQVIGDKKKCFIDEMGFMYSSKGEMLIAKTLRQLKKDFQYNAPITLPTWLINRLRKDYPKEILLEAGWVSIPSYITADFLIRIIPRTIIEYWGLENKESYNAKREIKEFIYRELKLRCISIEAHEDHNIPFLKKILLKKLEHEGG